MQNSPASEGGERAVDEAPQDAAADCEPSSDGAELQELRERAADFEDRYMRALADRDNYRKRAEADLQRQVSETADRINRHWLDAVDSVERALRTADPVNPMAEGLRAVLEQMESVLDRQGISRMGAVGDAFDPDIHEAVGVVESDQAPDRTIVDVSRSGWRMGDHVIRPAEVVVSRRPASDG